MNLNVFISMRFELILLVITLLLVVIDLVIAPAKKNVLVHVAILLFGAHTLIGFLPIQEARLFGGMFKSTSLIVLFKNILNVGVFIILLQSANWIKTELITKGRGAEFFILLFFSLLGMYFMLSSGDFLMFYLGLELSTLPVAALVAFDLAKRSSSEAGIKFILSAALASAIALFGISLIYATGSSIYFSEVATHIAVSNLSILGLVLFIAGLAFKISLAPFHFWTADVYEGAPIGVASYLSVISKGAAVFILLIVLYTVFMPFIEVWQNLMYILAVATMFIGNLFALRQQNMKRFLAFSSIAQAGFILLGLFTGTQIGTATVIYFVLIYVFSNLAAFGVVQAISSHTGKENMNDYNGLYRSNPKLSLVMMLALFSLAGIPPVAGFFGKFFLFTAAAGMGYYMLVFIAVVNVTISLYYYLLVIRAMFLHKSETPIPFFKNDWYMKLGLIITVIGILVLGVYSPLFDYIYNLSATLK
jgi:NADH-quinone oxidoreductase subunit N